MRESMGADPFSGAVYVFRAKRADRVKLVFVWNGFVSVRQEARGWNLPPAEDRRRCNASVGGAIVGCWRGSTGGLCMKHGRRRRQHKPDSCWRRCGEVNQERRTRRQMAANML